MLKAIGRQPGAGKPAPRRCGGRCQETEGRLQSNGGRQRRHAPGATVPGGIDKHHEFFPVRAAQPQLPGRVAIRRPVQPVTRKVVQPIKAPETGAKGERKMMQESRSNSYLFGGNAPYVEELYEAYLDNPGSVPDNWRAYFDRLQNVAAVDGSEVPRRGPRAGDRKLRPARQGQRLRAEGQRGRPGGGAQAGARAVADRGLSLPGQPLGRPGPAEAHRAAEDPGTGAGLLRPVRIGHGHHVLRGQHVLREGREHDAARDHAGAARNLLRHHRRGIHALHRPGREALVAGAAGKHPQQAQLHAPTRRCTSSTA